MLSKDPVIHWCLRAAAASAALAIAALSLALSVAVAMDIQGQARFDPADQREIVRRIEAIEEIVDIPPSVRNNL